VRLNAEAMSVAWEQIAYWRRSGVYPADVARALGLPTNYRWGELADVLAREWRSARGKLRKKSTGNGVPVDCFRRPQALAA
jgi:hypothetical protein